MSTGTNSSTANNKNNKTMMRSYLRSIENGSNLCSTQRETHVTRVSGSNGVHSQTTRFVRSGGERRHFVSFDGRAHLEGTDILLL